MWLDQSILVVVSRAEWWCGGRLCVNRWCLPSSRLVGSPYQHPFCRTYHFCNTDHTTARTEYTHKGRQPHTGGAKWKEKQLSFIHTTSLIWMRGDNSPSHCRRSDRDKRGVAKWERKRAARKGSGREKEWVEWRRIGPLVFFFSFLVCSYVGHFSRRLGVGNL